MFILSKSTHLMRIPAHTGPMWRLSYISKFLQSKTDHMITDKSFCRTAVYGQALTANL